MMVERIKRAWGGVSPLRLLLIAVCGVVAVLVAAFWSYTQDDVFITYVYSRNIATGVGFVFNAGERVQGTTTPLWALLMALVYHLTPNLLHAGNALGGICLALACLLAARLPATDAPPLARYTAPVLLATSPLVYVSLGMETLLYLLLLVAALWCWRMERRMLAMVCAAALTWTRADGVVLGAALCLCALVDSIVSTGRPRGPQLRAILWPSVRLGLLYSAAIAPWFLWAWWYFGTPLPNTFSAKQELFQGLAFITRIGEWFSAFYGNNWLAALLLPCALIGAWYSLRQRALRPLPLWTALYLAGYTALNITNFWYYTPLFAGVALLAAQGVGVVAVWGAHHLHGQRGQRVIGGVAVVALMAMVYTAVNSPYANVLLWAIAIVLFAWRFGLLLQQDRAQAWAAALGAVLIVVAILGVARALENRHAPPRMNTYALVGAWINANTPRDATLLVGDLGVAGYHAQRPTLDWFGLIVPTMATKTPEWAVANFQPQYVLANQAAAWDVLLADPAFHAEYTPLVQISTEGDAEFSPMTVYRRGPAPLSPVAVPAATVWGGWARLDAMQSTAAPLWSGGVIDLRMTWALDGATRADGANPSQDYTLFVHLLDASGQIVAQDDRAPTPTTRDWDSEPVAMSARLRLSPTLPTGRYTVRIGWYAADSTRLTLPDGGDSFAWEVDVQFAGGSGRP
jgi:hypothetical protein